METIKTRLNSLIQYLNISKNEFAREIGTSSAMISKITTKEVNFGVDIYQKILSRYTHLNQQWLLTGVGEMWNEHSRLNADVLEEINSKKSAFKESNKYHASKDDLDNIVSIHKDFTNAMSGITDLVNLLYKHKQNYMSETDYKQLIQMNEFTISKVFDVLSGTLNYHDYKKQLEIYLIIAKDLLFSYIRDLRAIESGFEPGAQINGSIEDLYNNYLEHLK